MSDRDGWHSKSVYSPLTALEQRQDELYARNLRNRMLAKLSTAALEKALTPHEDDDRSLQVRIASQVAIPTMKGIGEFAADVQSTVVIGTPPAEMLARWASQPLEPEPTPPLGLPDPPAPSTP